MLGLKEKIYVKAQDMMLNDGICTVTMDMIARECGISKRTLYEQIPDKRSLVWESLLYHWGQTSKRSEDILQSSPDTLSAVLQIYLEMREYYKRSMRKYIQDLSRLFPDLEGRYKVMFKERNTKFAKYLSKGVEEGMFRPDENVEVFSALFMLESHSIRDNIDYFPDNLTVMKICDMAFTVFMRGLVTPKGSEILEKFLTENILDK